MISGFYLLQTIPTQPVFRVFGHFNQSIPALNCRRRPLLHARRAGSPWPCWCWCCALPGRTEGAGAAALWGCYRLSVRRHGVERLQQSEGGRLSITFSLSLARYFGEPSLGYGSAAAHHPTPQGGHRGGRAGLATATVYRLCYTAFDVFGGRSVTLRREREGGREGG